MAAEGLGHGHYVAPDEINGSIQPRVESDHALAALKNPAPTVIAKQANITSGPQQINNAMSALEKQLMPNELLEAQDGQWMDPRAPSKAGSIDTVVETLGAL
jgi:hypothetical protein